VQCNLYSKLIDNNFLGEHPSFLFWLFDPPVLVSRVLVCISCIDYGSMFIVCDSLSTVIHMLYSSSISLYDKVEYYSVIISV
jgi:hypothetical protein